jgi:hypothetical protein
VQGFDISQNGFWKVGLPQTLEFMLLFLYAISVKDFTARKFMTDLADLLAANPSEAVVLTAS